MQLYTWNSETKRILILFQIAHNSTDFGVKAWTEFVIDRGTLHIYVEIAPICGEFSMYMCVCRQAYMCVCRQACMCRYPYRLGLSWYQPSL